MYKYYNMSKSLGIGKYKKKTDKKCVIVCLKKKRKKIRV